MDKKKDVLHEGARACLTRRRFLAGCGTGMAVASLPQSLLAADALHRPNILLITTDQQSAAMMSCTGNRRLRTPAMDRLAAEGVRFEAAYCTQPLCIPQRSSMYTGMMPHELGVTFNVDGKQLDRSLILGKIFSDSGYDTGYSGKWHFNVSSGKPVVHGFRQLTNVRANGADAQIADDLRAFLAMKRSSPFLFVASFNNPHNICEAARNQPLPEGEVGEAPLEAYPPLPDNFGIPDGEPPMIRVAQKRDIRSHPTANWDKARWRKHRWQYARMVELVDGRISETLEVLKKSGLSDNTLVVFTSDHGEGDGAHQWNQKSVLYEEACRIPFIISGPLAGAAGNVDDKHLISTGLDLIPTLCDYTGIAIPKHLRGRSVKPLIERRDLPWRDHIVIETEFGSYGKPYGMLGRCVRTERYKYMVYSEGKPCEQLVDLVRDPGEMHNLAADPAAAAEWARHQALLLTWARETGDRAFPYERLAVFDGGPFPSAQRDERKKK